MTGLGRTIHGLQGSSSATREETDALRTCFAALQTQLSGLGVRTRSVHGRVTAVGLTETASAPGSCGAALERLTATLVAPDGALRDAGLHAVGEHPTELVARADAELGEHLAQVVGDRVLADEQALADLGVERPSRASRASEPPER